MHEQGQSINYRKEGNKNSGGKKYNFWNEISLKTFNSRYAHAEESVNLKIVNWNYSVTWHVKKGSLIKLVSNFSKKKKKKKTSTEDRRQ